jgi:hypothetical protein
MVNPDIIRAQLDDGVMFGLSAVGETGTTCAAGALQCDLRRFRQAVSYLARESGITHGGTFLKPSPAPRTRVVQIARGVCCGSCVRHCSGAMATVLCNHELQQRATIALISRKSAHLRRMG